MSVSKSSKSPSSDKGVRKETDEQKYHRLLDDMGMGSSFSSFGDDNVDNLSPEEYDALQHKNRATMLSQEVQRVEEEKKIRQRLKLGKLITFRQLALLSEYTLAHLLLNGPPGVKKDIALLILKVFGRKCWQDALGGTTPNEQRKHNEKRYQIEDQNLKQREVHRGKHEVEEITKNMEKIDGQPLEEILDENGVLGEAQGILNTKGKKRK